LSRRGARLTAGARIAGIFTIRLGNDVHFLARDINQLDTGLTSDLSRVQSDALALTNSLASNPMRA
jgi:hypothetical protein